MRLLFVCTGNICRSAAADRLMADRLAPLGRSIQVRSAGTRARPGRPMHPHTERALARHGMSPGDFTSRRLSENDVEWADVVLTMTAEHREEVVAISPRSLHKVYTLSEAAALCSSLPHGRLDAVPPENRAALLAEELRGTRSRHARARGPGFDITDPIDGPTRLHVQVVDHIAAAIEILAAALDAPALGPQTVRMPRIPPVPGPSGSLPAHLGHPRPRPWSR